MRLALSRLSPMGASWFFYPLLSAPSPGTPVCNPITNLHFRFRVFSLLQLVKRANLRPPGHFVGSPMSGNFGFEIVGVIVCCIWDDQSPRYACPTGSSSVVPKAAAAKGAPIGDNARWQSKSKVRIEAAVAGNVSCPPQKKPEHSKPCNETLVPVVPVEIRGP